MKILLVYLVSVMLVLCWSEAQIADLDHLQLVNVWSPTFCSRANCQQNIPNNFYLHGLWPANRNGRLISGCPDTSGGTQAVTQAIRDNRRQLDAHWRSLKAGETGDRLWQDEWTKHGPCTALTPDNYFKTATTQQSKINLLRALNDDGIVPSNARTVTEANIVAAIRKKTANNNVYISCHSINNVYYLKEIRICLTRTGTDYFSCPAAGSPRNCGTNIIIPTSIDLDHLQLVNVWAPTYCSRANCKSRFNTNFYLHGLWPANRNGGLISGCPDNPGVTQAIAKNRRQLEAFWPSLIAGETGDYLWLHEWTKHGPCTALTPDNYFSTATTQQSKLNLLKALNDAGIIVSNTQTRTKQNIVAAIMSRQTGNKNVYISCQSINSTHSYLKEIFICLTKTGNEYYNCPGNGGKRNCAANIIIPSSIPRGRVDVAAI